jgi:hypothetical protein
VPIVLKSGSLNLLEPPRPVKACNGIALPFNFYRKLLDVVEITNTMHWLYQSFILYTGPYMFRQ